MDKLIYLDNAATTRLCEEAFEKMKPYYLENYANPSSVYRFAAAAREAVEQARDDIAAIIGAKGREIYFTAGGSEADNWALKGAAWALRDKGRHIITTSIEHHAVLNTCRFLEKNGYEVTYLPVDGEGRVRLSDLEEAVRPDTILISVMYANNEIGTIEDIKEIGAAAAKRGILFHTDAVQAFAHIPIDVNEMNIDLLSASGHKFHGPKGVGFLYVRDGVRITNLIHGGGQEHGKRAGTVNVAQIVGMAEAAKYSAGKMEENAKKMTELRDYLIDRVLREIPYTRLNGSRRERLPGSAHFCFRFIEGESLLILLDGKGICASSGSACTSGSLDPSHVLLAIGLPHEIAHGSLRLTLSEENTMEEMERVVSELKRIVERLRAMSPLYEDFIKSEKKITENKENV